MNRNPIGRQRDTIFFASNHHSLAKNNQKIGHTFQTVVSTVPSYGYREQPTKTEQRLYGELVRPAENSQLLTTPVIEQQTSTGK